MSFSDLKNKLNRKILFTTPSHSQKYCILSKFKNFYKFDVSETDAYEPVKMLNDAEIYAANVYGVKKTKFLTNGSSSGVIASVLSCVNTGDNVLIYKNAHRCHLNSIKLAGAKPVYYDLPINDFGVPSAFNNIEEYLKSEKIKAVIVTSPTYEGFVSDIKKIKEICKKYNVYLIVDEAHGALYPFSDELPESAVKIADFTVQSLHKTAGGLNPTALVHTNTSLDIDGALDLITTTSPSYPLLMSIEKNIRFLNSNKGRKEIHNLITSLKDLRTINNIQFGGDDITKILIKKNGFSGQKLSEYLYNMGIEDEKTNDISTMLLTGIGTTKKKIEKLKRILAKL